MNRAQVAFGIVTLVVGVGIGAPADEVFILLDNGIGFYEEYNWDLCGFERFR